jgi:hypothetical protein
MAFSEETRLLNGCFSASRMAQRVLYGEIVCQMSMLSEESESAKVVLSQMSVKCVGECKVGDGLSSKVAGNATSAAR